jgi:serine/threonine-protein kinase RsbW
MASYQEARIVTKPRIEKKLTLESRLDEVCPTEEAIIEAAQEFGFSQSDRFAIKLALEEALSNAIKHGNACDPVKSVVVEYHVDEVSLTIIIGDEGPGFDVGEVPDPCLEENLAKPTGRGVMLMKAYMDEVEYNSTGNRITMVKYRKEGETPDAASE